MMRKLRINAPLCRAARGFLDWTAADLARASGVSSRAISAFERGITTPHDRTLRDLEEAFQKAGIEFFESEGSAFAQGIRWCPLRAVD